MKQGNHMQSEKEKDGAPGNCWGRKGEYDQNLFVQNSQRYN